MNFTKLATLLLLIGCCMPLVGKSHSGDPASKDLAFVAALSLKEETQCVGTKPRDMEARVALTNTSTSDVILQRGLGQSVTVLGLFGTNTLSPLLQSWSSTSDGGPGATVTEVTIHPGDTFAYMVHLKLDPEILKQPGFYKVQVTYDLARPNSMIGRTNWAIFQVRECDATGLHNSKR